MADGMWQTVSSKKISHNTSGGTTQKVVKNNNTKLRDAHVGSENNHKKIFPHPTTSNRGSGSPLAPEAPVFGERSAFDALNVKERRSKTAERKSGGDVPNVVKSNIPRAQKKPKKTVMKKSLDGIVPTITAIMLGEVNEKAKVLFKGAPLMCLKDLTGWLNSHLDEIPQSDPTFTGFPENYPSSLLVPDARKLLQRSINECSSESLALFLDQLIQSVLTDLAKGLTVHGYQIIAQLVARHKPDLFTRDLSKYVELIINNRNSPAKCLTVMWILGQCGAYNFRSGLQVWTGLMLKMIGVKALAGYSIGYISQLLKKYRNSTNNKIDDSYGVISMEDYFLLLDGVYTTGNNLQPALQKQLREHYPLLKQLAFGKGTGKKLVRFFPSFLTRVSGEGGAETSPALQLEIMENCILCLRQNPETFNVWAELYGKHLPESSALLNYIAEKWNSQITAKLDKKTLKETVRGFTAANENYNKAKPGRGDCIAACQRLDELFTSEAEETTSKVKSLIIMSLVVIAGCVVFDLYTHGSYQGSTARRLLKAIGMDVYFSTLGSHIKVFFISAAQYLTKNVPQWAELTYIYLEPILERSWQITVASMQYVLRVSEPARHWLTINIPLLIEWVVMHPIWATLYTYLMDTWLILEPYVTSAIDNMTDLAFNAKIYITSLIY